MSWTPQELTVEQACVNSTTVLTARSWTVAATGTGVLRAKQRMGPPLAKSSRRRRFGAGLWDFQEVELRVDTESFRVWKAVWMKARKQERVRREWGREQSVRVHGPVPRSSGRQRWIQAESVLIIRWQRLLEFYPVPAGGPLTVFGQRNECSFDVEEG